MMMAASIPREPALTIDRDFLEDLRKRFGSAAGGEMEDPHFRAVATSVFKDGDSRKWPFADPATFLDARFIENGLRPEVLEALDVALIGVPMDLGVTNRAGARLGPRAVRAVERVGPYEHVLRVAPMGGLKVADVGDVPMRSRFGLAECHADIEACYRMIAATGVIPLSVGGDHSISGAILKGLAASQPVGMIHIDAHCDTAGPYEGSKFHHGAPFREAVLAGVLDPKRTIQIGIRGGGEYLWEFSFASGMTVIHAEEVAEIGLKAVIAKALEVVGAGPTYLSFDVDSLDPAFAPGTGTPEVGGLQPREVLTLLRGFKSINLIGGDVVEIAPQYDNTTNTAQIAAQVLFELLCLAMFSPAVRTNVT
ncbi:agmatinase [Rhizobium leguminosarum bv. viciae]|nr:agmatinase [Rhizobium leguminosarum bv. viciae]QIO59599.1 agmatinase [Rhizobium leguminosarum bv. trifolii]TBZ73992.1 agmatinase [Rhizobium leguminosarum bv. viciae]